MEDWSALEKEVYSDFKEDGFTISIRLKGSPGTFNPSTLQYDGAVSDTDYLTYGVKKLYDMRMIDGTIIQQNDTRLFFPSYDLPTLGTDTKIIISGKEVNVIRLKKVDPGNSAILYEAQIRE